MNTQICRLEKSALNGGKTESRFTLSTTGSCRIRVDEERIDKIYFYFFLRYYRPKMHEIASAGVQAFLNMQHIKGFEVPAPDLVEQRQFSKLVKSVMKLQEKQNCASMKPLFDVLSQKSFRR